MNKRARSAVSSIREGRPLFMEACAEWGSCYLLLKEELSDLSDGRQQDDEENDGYVARDC